MSYTIPIGPYHPSLEEPVHARLTVDGEMITDAKVFIGYNHRGIEKLAQERNFIQTDVLVERVCGICSHSHAMTYAMCVENIAGMEVPKRGQYIRVIISELERIHSHLLWLGIACHIIPRLRSQDTPISASTVRLALQQGDWQTLKTLVPPTTYAYFTSPQAAPVVERIQKAGNVVHY